MIMKKWFVLLFVVFLMSCGNSLPPLGLTGLYVDGAYIESCSNSLAWSARFEIKEVVNNQVSIDVTITRVNAYSGSTYTGTLNAADNSIDTTIMVNGQVFSRLKGKVNLQNKSFIGTLTTNGCERAFVAAKSDVVVTPEGVWRDSAAMADGDCMKTSSNQANVKMTISAPDVLGKVNVQLTITPASKPTQNISLTGTYKRFNLTASNPALAFNPRLSGVFDLEGNFVGDYGYACSNVSADAYYDFAAKKD
jgi:hypothetical protein